MTSNTPSRISLLLRFASLFVALLTTSFAQDLELPTDYQIDLQLAMSGRSSRMGTSSEITGTRANVVGDEVFHKLISAGFGLPYPWKLTLVGNDSVNAESTAAGQLYVYGGILPILGENRGLWAAVLSHEVAHTSRRHQVRRYIQVLYNQQIIANFRARIAAGDRNANWGLIGFEIGSAIAMKKMMRDQEHDADAQGMLLMARAGYHPDYVFALHHVLLARTGDQSKFAAFFSDHPRWETRDQRSEKAYGDALAQFEQSWPDSDTSPGGRPPLVAFIGHPEAKENKTAGSADVSIPMYCRNATHTVDAIVLFQKGKHPVPSADPEFADKEGNLAYRQEVTCPTKDEAPVAISIPATVVSPHDRSVKAMVFVATKHSLIAQSKTFDVHFPKVKK
jgi:hypothetical protein